MPIINPSFDINNEKKDNQILIKTPYIYSASFPYNIYFFTLLL